MITFRWACAVVCGGARETLARTVPPRRFPAVQRNSLYLSTADPTSPCSSESAGRSTKVEFMDRTVKNLCLLQMRCEASRSMHYLSARRAVGMRMGDANQGPVRGSVELARSARVKRSGAVGCQSVVRPAVRRSRWRSRTAEEGPLKGMTKGAGRQLCWGGRPGHSLERTKGRCAGRSRADPRRAHPDRCLSAYHLWTMPTRRMVSAGTTA